MPSLPVSRRPIPGGFRVGGVSYGSHAAGRSSSVYWNDSEIKAKVVTAFRLAGIDTMKVTKARAPAKRISRSITVKFGSGGAMSGMNIAGIIRAGNPLSHLFELGTKPHMIAPQSYKFAARTLSPRVTLKNTLRSRPGGSTTSQFNKAGGRVALKFPNGGFARGPVQHPGMKERPFMRPSAATFHPFFLRRARSIL